MRTIMKMAPRLACVALAAVLIAGGYVRAEAKDADVKGKVRVVTRDDLRRLATTQPTKSPTTQPAKLAEAKTVADARGYYNKGQYKAAEAGFRRFADSGDQRTAAAIGLADALGMQGRYADALVALSKAGKGGPADAQWQVTRATLLATTGQYDKSLAAARAALAIRPDWAPAIFAAGRMLEVSGKKAEAMATYQTVEKSLSDKAFLKDPPSLVAAGLVLDRLAILSGRKASEQSQNILNQYLQRAYLDVDGTYWPARLASGMFLLRKHRPKMASGEFDAANRINPKLPEVGLGMALAQLGAWQFEKAEAAVAKALKINPHHPDLHVARAMTLLQWRKFDQVAKPLQKALAVNPNHLEALSLLVALHIREYEPAKAEPYIERIEKVHNGPYAGMHLVVGEWLSAGRQFKLAAEHLRQAIELAPELADPWTELGLVQMRRGDEADAMKTLVKARQIDDFRADVLNYIKTLKYMVDNLAVKETENFIVKVHKTHDAVLLDQISDYMEKIHPEICGDYNYFPDEKSIIEIFPTHKGFSARITGKGWIGTVGASTGRVIALVAPHPERSPQFGRFNWATVLRHEYTHTITLAATNNRIPHWFTEALAVYQQPDRRNFTAAKALAAATKAKKLFTIETMDWGFIRPKERGARSLAYAQAEWTAEYIIGKYGYDAIIKMLEGFRDGLTQAEVFSTVLSTNEKDFNKAFGVWAREQVTEWGFDLWTPPKLAAAQAAARKAPKDADAQATLALVQLMSRKAKDAEKTANKALELDSGNARAIETLMRIAQMQKKESSVIELANRLDKADPTSKLAPRVLATIHLKHRRFAPAIIALERLKLRMPLDSWSYEQLAKIYHQLGQTERALPNLVEINRHNLRDTRWPKQIAEIHRAAGRKEEALYFYGQLLEINPYDSTAYQTMTALYLRSGQYDQAVRHATFGTQVAPEVADTWAVLARVCYLAGRKASDRSLYERGLAAANRAIELEPLSPAGQIKVAIQKALAAGEGSSE